MIDFSKACRRFSAANPDIPFCVHFSIIGSNERILDENERLTQARTLRSRNALLTTETELKLIAAAAMIGLSRIPKNG